ASHESALLHPSWCGGLSREPPPLIQDRIRRYAVGPSDNDMVLTTRGIGDTVIVDINGKLTMGEAAATLRETVRHGLDEGQRKFVVNLAGCEYMDSAGMGELSTALMRIHNAGGQLRIVKVTKRVHDILGIAKLQSVFECHEDETKAIESMQ